MSDVKRRLARLEAERRKRRKGELVTITANGWRDSEPRLTIEEAEVQADAARAAGHQVVIIRYVDNWREHERQTAVA